MNDKLIIGIILIIAGILLIFSSFSSKPDVKFAVGGFLGPIPFGFANSPGMLKLIIILSVVVLLLVYFSKLQ